MVTSKFIRSFFPLGKDISHAFGRFNSLMSTRNKKVKIIIWSQDRYVNRIIQFKDYMKELNIYQIVAYSKFHLKTYSGG